MKSKINRSKQVRTKHRKQQPVARKDIDMRRLKVLPVPPFPLRLMVENCCENLDNIHYLEANPTGRKLIADFAKLEMPVLDGEEAQAYRQIRPIMSRDGWYTYRMPSGLPKNADPTVSQVRESRGRQFSWIEYKGTAWTSFIDEELFAKSLYWFDVVEDPMTHELATAIATAGMAGVDIDDRMFKAFLVVSAQRDKRRMRVFQLKMKKQFGEIARGMVGSVASGGIVDVAMSVKMKLAEMFSPDNPDAVQVHILKHNDGERR